MNAPKRPAALMLLAQAVCIAAMVLTLALMLLSALLPAVVPVQALGALLLGGCALWMEGEGCFLCKRMRQTSAFSAANVAALGRVTLALLLAGTLLLYFGHDVMDVLLAGLPPVTGVIRWGLPTFAAWTLAAMVRTVQLLMRRALDIQDETELTV